MHLSSVVGGLEVLDKMEKIETDKREKPQVGEMSLKTILLRQTARVYSLCYE